MRLLSGKVFARCSVVVLAVALLGALPLAGTGGSGVLGQGKVLILDTTLDEGATFNEADAATNQGFAVDIVTPTEWAALTAVEFASYRAIIFADPDCLDEDDTILAAALGNVTVWAPVVRGNVIVHTFDPIAHGNEAGSDELIEDGVAYATAVATKTGMYMSTSCYDGPTVKQVLDGVAPGWEFVPEEDWDNVDCDTIYLVNPLPPELAGLTAEELSDWGCSTHAFFGAWPAAFTVLAIISADATMNGARVTSNSPGGPLDEAADCECRVADDYTFGEIVGSPVMLVRAALADPVPPIVVTPTFTG